MSDCKRCEEHDWRLVKFGDLYFLTCDDCGVDARDELSRLGARCEALEAAIEQAAEMLEGGGSTRLIVAHLRRALSGPRGAMPEVCGKPRQDGTPCEQLLISDGRCPRCDFLAPTVEQGGTVVEHPTAGGRPQLVIPLEGGGAMVGDVDESDI